MTSYIDDTINRSRLVTGADAGPDEVAREFAKMQIAERVNVLARIEKEEGQFGAKFSTPREAATRHPYVAALKNMHARLLEVKR